MSKGDCGKAEEHAASRYCPSSLLRSLSPGLRPPSSRPAAPLPPPAYLGGQASGAEDEHVLSIPQAHAPGRARRPRRRHALLHLGGSLLVAAAADGGGAGGPGGGVTRPWVVWGAVPAKPTQLRAPALPAQGPTRRILAAASSLRPDAAQPRCCCCCCCVKATGHAICRGACSPHVQRQLLPLVRLQVRLLLLLLQAAAAALRHLLHATQQAARAGAAHQGAAGLGRGAARRRPRRQRAAVEEAARLAAARVDDLSHDEHWRAGRALGCREGAIGAGRHGSRGCSRSGSCGRRRAGSGRQRLLPQRSSIRVQREVW